MRYTVTFDATDPRALAEWWAATLEWDVRGGDDMAVIVPRDRPEDDDEHILFLRVPEAKAAKNRCHIDLHPTGDTDAFLADLISRGAVQLSHQGEGWPVRWAVMADPEGNEFCVVLGKHSP